ncbi:PRP1 splicing factor, N-terminal-domain-containing protein [Phlyctochytrium arcticum]|nr:PRP1 splicing factor, N-terminal-domain-containing protein [Phlyctochytrium arcticum]
MYQFKQLVVPDFINKKPPPNYIAGLGRGATGFTTRSDIGPAREGPSDAALEKAKAAAEGKGPRNDDDDDDEQFQDPDNETGLFNALPYEADDEEADRIYEEIDAKMDERRRARREAREREELEKYRKERPKIQQQFADLKRGLSIVSDEEWASIPEVADFVRKGKRQKKFADRYVAVPDSVLLGASAQNQFATQLDAKQQLLGGLATPAAADGTMTDFVQFGQARDKVLGLKLDQISDSVTGQSIIDPKGYLTDLNSIVVKTDAEISDIKKARTLLKSVITTNPKHAPGWIAAARLEEVAGKHGAARETIAKGCEECPTSEDVWLEAARLNTAENAKVMLAQAVRHVPQSVKVWIKACDLENDTKSKKRVLRRALEFIPNSIKIWKAVVSMEEDPDDARILLSRAVECVPLAVELWLALARLEKYDSAKKVLNKARLTNPTNHDVWITAAKLEETNENEKGVEMIIHRAVDTLQKKGAPIDRDQWIQEAEKAEKENYMATCQAIIRESIAMGVDDEDKKSTWMEDAQSCISHGSFATARAIYAYALKEFPEKKSIWRRAAYLEKNHGTRESLEELLQRAVRYCPQAEILWLMAAKEKWLSGDITAAKRILEAAFAANPNSEEIWLAAIKLEVETGEYERARVLLASAREQANTERVWMKAALLERQLGQFDAALDLLKEGIAQFPQFAKLWMMKGQIEHLEKGDIPAARETYAAALKQVPKSITLWLLASRLEEAAGAPVKSRKLLETARIMNPNVPELWCEAVRFEMRANNTAMAKALLAKSLQVCPTSGLLWSEAITMEARPQRKARSADALKKCENDALVVVTVARLFWAERKIEKARNWFNRAVKTNPDLGDSWAWWLKFEMQHGTEEQRKELIAKCVAAEPRHGERWQEVAKSRLNHGKTTEEILKLVAAQMQNAL